MDVDAAFGHWLAGFIDGEGSFFIRRSTQRDGRTPAYQCIFSVSLRRDDRETLVMIQETLGIGRLRDHRGRGGTRPHSTWMIDTKADCVEFVKFLSSFPLRSKKQRDAASWCEAVTFWVERVPGTRNGPGEWAPMETLKVAMETARAYPIEAVV